MIKPTLSEFNKPTDNYNYWQNMPENIKKTFSKETVNTLYNHFKDPLINELLDLIKDHSHNEKEIIELIMQMPEYYDLCFKILKSTDSLIKTCKDKLYVLAKKCFANYQFNKKDTDKFRSSLGFYFNNTIALIHQVNREVDGLFFDVIYRKIVVDFLFELSCVLEKLWGNKMALEFINNLDNEELGFNAGIHIEEIHKSKQLGIYFQEEIMLMLNQNHDLYLLKNDELNDYCDILFDEINEMSYFRTIKNNKRFYGEAAITIYGDEFMENRGKINTEIICFVNINLEEKNLPFKLPKWKGKENEDISIFDFSDSKGFYGFSLSLDRTNRELNIFGIKFPLSKIMSNDIYLKLKYTVCSYIHDYLSKKEDDKVDLFKFEIEIDNIKAETAKQIDQISNNNNNLINTNFNELLDNEEVRYTFNNLQNKNGSRVQRTIRKILGERMSKGKGSHIKYKNEAGNSMSVPFSKGTMKAGTLKNILRFLQISEATFLENY